MAPSPVLNVEPKEPDKNNDKFKESVSHKDKQSTLNIESGSSSKDKVSVDSLSFHEIEEAGLKSLLDEAYSYKSPKDRVGKSVLFQELLNEVEENDVGKKKLSDRSKGFIDGLKAAAAIENGHDTVSDKAFLNNILGNCEKEKKKKKHKRDGSSTNNSSRKSKFTHSLKINHGPQSSYTYNGSNSVHYHSSSRSLSRAQQSLSARLSSSKAATLLTSSSNIDVSMVTTYNKQPIMTPALVPSIQQKNAELLMLDLQEQNANCDIGSNDVSKNVNSKPNEIEMKVLRKDKHNDSVHNYTTHASLEIGGGGSEESNLKHQLMDNEKLPSDSSPVSAPLQSLTTLINGNAEKSVENLVAYTPQNGLSDEKEEIENVITNNNENVDEEKQRKKYKKKAAYLDETVDSSSRTSVSKAVLDDSETVSSLHQKNMQNSTTANSTLKFQTESPWSVPALIVTLAGDSSATLGRSMCTKESLESRRSYDENSSTFNQNYSFINNAAASVSRDRTDNGSERKHKPRKPKKPNSTSILSENIEGYCGDKSISYLLQYIENNKSAGNGTPSGNPKNLKSKSSSGSVLTKNGEKQKGRASTDEDIRHKKLPKSKERLKKSTSLEDLRHDKSKSNKKQSSVDDSHYTTAKEGVEMIKELELKHVGEFQLPVDESHLYFDNLLIDDDNYTETEFHLVTKKQRKKKRRSKSRTSDRKTCSGGAGEGTPLSQNFLPHNYTDKCDSSGFKRSTRGNAENRHRSRRKSVSSVMPSDKISDTDSIHSLPVSSTTPKCKIKKKSTSSGCTPQASYADIAKSPQCQSSNALNGDAKWHMKTFSNSPSSASSTSSSSSSSFNTHSTTVSSLSSACSSNTGDSLDHPDTPELVSSTKYEDHVELNDSCDQLLLTDNCNNIISNSSGPDSPSVNTTDEVKSSSGTSNVSYSDVKRIELTLKRKGKTNKKSENDDDNNNNNHVCCNVKSENLAKDDNTNASANKIKKVKNKKKNNVEERNIGDDTNNHGNNASNSNSNSSSSSNTSAGKCEDKNDLFVEFTLKRSQNVATKCSETQTDLIEVNNNACCSEISVEQTIVLKCNRNGADDGAAKVNKLSHSLPVDETGNKIVVLKDMTDNEISVGFNVSEQLLNTADTSTKQKQEDTAKELTDCSSKYNVSEVIQFVNKSWNEVMKTLSSVKVAAANNKVQYYSAK